MHSFFVATRKLVSTYKIVSHSSFPVREVESDIIANCEGLVGL
jgi:hypothetical protein